MPVTTATRAPTPLTSSYSTNSGKTNRVIHPFRDNMFMGDKENKAYKSVSLLMALEK